MKRSTIQIVSQGSGQTADRNSGAVAIDDSRLTLNIPIGPYSGRSIITVSDVIDQKLRTLSSRISLVGKGVHIGGYKDSFEKTDFTIHDLYLAERLGSPDPNDPTIVQWIIEDNRRWLQNIQSLGFMNKQRIANEFDDLVEVGTNFGQFHRIGVFAYFVNTTKDKSAVKFARFDAEEFAPWTAFQGLKFMLTTFFEVVEKRVLEETGTKFRPRIKIIEEKVIDNGFPLQNFSLNGPWPIVVARLMRLAHVSFVPNAKGEWVVFRLDPKKFPRKIGGYSGAGNAIRRDRNNSRSQSHKSIFRSRYDIRADFVEGSSASGAVTSVVDESNILPVQLLNVVITPFDMTDENGDTVKRGTILEISEFLRVVNLDPERHFSSNFRNLFGSLTLCIVKRLVTSPDLAYHLTVDSQRTLGRNPFGAAIAKTLYDFYRKLMQIPKGLRDNLDKIKTVTSEVADTRTGKQMPTRVHFDHTLIPTFWGAGNPGTMPEEGSGFFTQRPWPAGDQTRKLDDANPSDFAEVKVFDQTNGLFLVKTLSDLEGNFGRVIFTTFKTLPPNVVGIDGISHFLSQTEQDDQFRLSFVFSAELISSNPENYFIVEKPPEEEPTTAKGPVHEERVRQVFAGFSWNDDTSAAEIDEKTGEFIVSGFDLYNKNRLESIALGLRQTHYFYMEDWLIGRFKAAGYNPDVDSPRGNYGVSLNHSEGFFEASYDAKSPKPKPIFEVISEEAAELLFKLDEDTL